MKVAAFIARRLAFAGNNREEKGEKPFSRFIIRLSVAATIISVMVMIITLSLANGFKKTVSRKVFSFIGHIRVLEKEPGMLITSEETPIFKNDSVVSGIRQYPGVTGIHPYATRYCILKTKNEIEGVMVKGFDSTVNLSHLTPFIQQGRMITWNDSSYSREIMLSAFTAKRLQVQAGDRILVFFIRPDGSLRPDKLTITGIFKTGIEEYDKTFAIGDLKLIQRLNGWQENEISGYEIFCADYKESEQIAAGIYQSDYFPLTWNTLTARNISPNIFDWLNLQDKNTMILLIIMAVVAVINLVTCFLILVLERVKMIGILKATGATNWQVQQIFLRHALFITTRGILAGTALALSFLWLQKKTGFIRLKEEAYYVSTAEVQVEYWQVLAVGAGTLAICFLVLLVPSLLVRRIQPVRAVHFR